MKRTAHLITCAILAVFSSLLSFGQPAEEGKPVAPPREPRHNDLHYSRPLPNKPPISPHSFNPHSFAEAVSRVEAHPGTSAVRMASPFRRERMASSLIVQHSKEDPKVIRELQEDLAVMSRILEKSIGENTERQRARVMGIDVLTLHSPAPARNLYIQGHGALFTYTVETPLLPEPGQQETEKTAEPVNADWEEARNEIFGEPGRRRRSQENRRRPYDARAVEALRDSVIEVLPNAGNIRHLAPTDWITVVLRGGPSVEELEGELKLYMRSADDPSGSESGPAGSTMVIRVQRGALGDGLKNKPDLESLRKNVSVVIY